ncbi:hypothetical protein WT71_25255 [Burkholderia stagnalis]|nr:hypothetical protein WT71_25255 [Burkholderia stagnalis]KWI81141.1 hypothetical protein WT73_27895 [Burkholderia stagnalis]
MNATADNRERLAIELRRAGIVLSKDCSIDRSTIDIRAALAQETVLAVISADLYWREREWTAPAVFQYYRLQFASEGNT